MNFNSPAMIAASCVKLISSFEGIDLKYGKFRLFIFMPICLVLIGCGEIAPSKSPVTSGGADQIFMRSFSRQIAVGKEMQSILNVEQSDLSMASGSMKLLSEQIQHLNYKEKTKLMLMYLIVFEFDGEKAEKLGTFLGDDRVSVGRALAQISVSDFSEACRNLGVSETRYRMFRRLVNRWQK